MLTASRHEIFDSQARKQFLDKAPDRNPFGTEEEPTRFQDFDVFTKVGRILIRGPIRLSDKQKDPCSPTDDPMDNDPP